jgi:hypothetical protein
VQFRSDGIGPFGTIKVSEVVPANEAAQRLSPTLRPRTEPPIFGPYACSLFYTAPHS